MKKKILSCIIAGAMMSAVGLPTTLAFADTTQQATQSNQQTNQPATTTPTDSSNAGGGTASQTDGPVITTSHNDYLVLVGSKFDTKTDLGLKVTDPVNSDLASKIDVKPISTAKPALYTLQLKCTDSNGKSAEKTVKINVIQIAKEVELPNMDALANANLLNYVTGNKTNLKATIQSQNNNQDTFVMAVTNGEQTVTQTVQVKLNGAVNTTPKTSNDSNAATTATTGNGTGTSSATGTGTTTPGGTTNASTTATGTNPTGSAGLTSSTTSTSTTTHKTDLPKTGSVPIAAKAFGGLALLGAIGIIGFKVKTGALSIAALKDKIGL